MPAATTEERSSSQKQTALGRQGSGAGGPNTNSERLLDETFRLSAGAATATATVVAIPSTPTTVSPRSQRRQRQQQQQLVQSAPATPRREAQALPAASVSTSTANSSSALLGPQHLNLGGSNIAATSSLQGRTFEAHPAPHSAGIAGLHMLTGRGSTGSDDVIRGAHDGTSGNLPQPPTNGYPLATAMKQRSSDARDVRLAERLDYWQRRIVMSGLVGFIGYYFLRTDLIVCLNTILKSLPGVDKAEFGTILSFGYVCYAIGKVFGGVLIDRYGGASIFKGGLVGSILATLLFASIDVVYDEQGAVVDQKRILSIFGIAWSLNRAAQSAGWGALVKIIYNWFPVNMHGRVLGVASLSYGLGDVLIRVFLGSLLTSASDRVAVTDPTTGASNPERAAYAWRYVFYMSMVIACVLLVPSLLWLKNDPESVPELDGINTDGTLIEEQGADTVSKAKVHLRSQNNPIDTVRFLLHTPKFWALITMSPCLTLLRESLMSWTAVFISDTLNIKDGEAAMMSMLIPLFGTISTVSGGFLIDRVPPKKRGLLLSGCLIACMVALFLTAAFIPEGVGAISDNPAAVYTLLALVSLTLMAPYSFVDGVFVLEIAGQRGPGIALGLVHGIGYCGAILAGHEVGMLAELHGWHYVFSMLSSLSVVTVVAALVYWWLDFRELGMRRRARGSGSGGSVAAAAAAGDYVRV